MPIIQPLNFEPSEAFAEKMLNCKIDKNLELLLYQPRDAEELNALIEGNFNYIKRWSAWLKDRRSIENTRAFIERNLKQFADGEGFALGIWFDGEMAGQIEFNYLDWQNRKTEIGFWLGESFQGKGLVTKSCRVLIDYAFDQLKLNRVEMLCGAENIKSRKIAEKLGFREEGIMRQAVWLHDCFVDFVIYAMLANDREDKNCL
jgi:ribosomal-protein-serine acetyltransferase